MDAESGQPSRRRFGAGPSGRSEPLGAIVPVSRPLSVLTFPSSDVTLRDLVARLIEADAGIIRPADLEARLRSVYPRVRVRRRELSNEPSETWYVYREGMFSVASGADDWWASGEVATADYGADGRIVAVSAAFARLMRSSPAELVGLRFTDLIASDGAAAARHLRAILDEVGVIETTARFLRSDGTAVDVEHRTVLTVSGFRSYVRRAVANRQSQATG